MFEVGDYVYASDWCYGRIIDLDYDGAFIEFETGFYESLNQLRSDGFPV